MQPNYVNYYDNYEINQRKPQMMAPLYHSTPHNPSPSIPEPYYQQRAPAPNNMNALPPQTMNMLYSNREANYFENAKYPTPQNVQNVGPMYSSYNNPSPVMNSNNLVNAVPNNLNAPGSFNSFGGSATHNSHNHANMSGGSHFPARDREDVSFFLQSFQNYFQEQGIFIIYLLFYVYIDRLLYFFYIYIYAFLYTYTHKMNGVWGSFSIILKKFISC